MAVRRPGGRRRRAWSRPPKDRRGTIIKPTEAGNAAWERTVGTQARREAMFASVLDEAEREELHRLLRRLMRAFPDKGHPCEPDETPPPGGVETGPDTPA